MPCRHGSTPSSGRTRPIHPPHRGHRPPGAARKGPGDEAGGAVRDGDHVGGRLLLGGQPLCAAATPGGGVVTAWAVLIGSWSWAMTKVFVTRRSIVGLAAGAARHATICTPCGVPHLRMRAVRRGGMVLLALFVVGPLLFLMGTRRKRPGAVRHLGPAFLGGLVVWLLTMSGRWTARRLPAVAGRDRWRHHGGATGWPATRLPAEGPATGWDAASGSPCPGVCGRSRRTTPGSRGPGSSSSSSARVARWRGWGSASASGGRGRREGGAGDGGCGRASTITVE